ncbi:TonB-dependent receptor domain-containing protein, partial [Aliarcobacter butzleri]
MKWSDTLKAINGTRCDDISSADSKTTYQAGVVQKLGENTRIRANYARGYRAPDIAVLFVGAPLYKDGKRYGSADENSCKT